MDYPGSRQPGVSFVACKPSTINQYVIDINKQLGGDGANHDIQILSPTRTGNDGVETLNLDLQKEFKNNELFISYFDKEFGVIDYLGKNGRFKVNDLFIYTQNDYKRGLRNGSLGKIVQKLNPQKESDPVCVAEFEDEPINLNHFDLEKLELSYAITVHKAQKSQFDVVIIPVRKSKLLDLTLLYTATTRSVEQVFLVGSHVVAKDACKTCLLTKEMWV